MTSNATRADVLARALRAGVARDLTALGALVTDDVRAWTPAVTAGSRAELLASLDERDDAYDDHDLEVVALDVGGDFACAEWTVAMTHAGAITLPDGRVVEPTGNRVVVHGITVAEFEGSLICSLRQYWDELAALEQLGIVRRSG